MKIEEFGEQLLLTLDLDPVYVMLYRAKLDDDILKRWCLAYWCFYHSGVASRIASSPDFYGTTEQAFDEGWPRASERRHFRGEKAWDCIRFLQAYYPKPEDWVDLLLEADNYKEFYIRATDPPMFGSWIAFKMADMRDRVLGSPLSCHPTILNLYKNPKEGALVAGFDSLEQAVGSLTGHYREHLAPPFEDRPVGLYEVETILCKYKSYKKGTYWVGKDIKEIRHHLTGWGELASYLWGHLPEKVKC